VTPMECREIREIISAYVDGEASPEEARRVEEHLGSCAQCRSAEKRMRALGVAVTRTEGSVPPDFRESLFARMEAEDLLPKRRSIFVFSVRWAAVPLAAAAAMALYVLSSREAPREFPSPAVGPPRVAREMPGPGTTSPEAGSPSSAPREPAGSPPAVPGKEERKTQVVADGGKLSPEDREIVANLEILEDPDLFDEPQIDEMEIFVPSFRRQG